MATFNVGPYTYASGAQATGTPTQFSGLADAMANARPVNPLDRLTDPVARRNFIAGQARNELQERLGQALMQRELMGDDPGPTAMIDPTKLSKQDAQNLFMTATYTGPEFRLDPGADFQSEFDALYNDPAKLARALMQTQPQGFDDSTDIGPKEAEPPKMRDINSIGDFVSTAIGGGFDVDGNYQAGLRAASFPGNPLNPFNFGRSVASFFGFSPERDFTNEGPMGLPDSF